MTNSRLWLLLASRCLNTPKKTALLTSNKNYTGAETDLQDTNHFVTSKQLTKTYQVKDHIILKDLYATLGNYREAIWRLGAKVDYMNAEDIRVFLEKHSQIKGRCCAGLEPCGPMAEVQRAVIKLLADEKTEAPASMLQISHGIKLPGLTGSRVQANACFDDRQAAVNSNMINPGYISPLQAMSIVLT